MKTEFYRTTGSSVLYAKNSKDLKPIIDNWQGTGEVKVKNGILYISERAWDSDGGNIMGLNNLPYKVVAETREQRDRFRAVMLAIKKADQKELEGEDDYDDERGVEVSEVCEIVEFELESDIFIRFRASASAVIKNRFHGDSIDPPSCDIDWDDVEIDEILVFIGVPTVNFNKVQYEAIKRELAKKITLK